MKYSLSILLWLVCATFSAAEDTAESLNPSLEAYVAASVLYGDGQYQQAYDQFLVAAQWGNKLAQYNIGTMHQNGQGVAKDPARAWAWLQLSAERDYGALSAIADEVYAELSTEQQSRGTRILNRELLPKFSDATVLPTVQRYLDRQYRMATGSRLGGSGSSQLIVQPNDELPKVGDIYYAKDRWQVSSWLDEEKRWFEAMTQAGDMDDQSHSP